MLTPKKKKVGFSFSLSQVTVPVGTLLLTVLWTKVLILQTPFGRVQCKFPALPTKASSTIIPIRALHWEGAAGWRPQPLPLRKQITLGDPNGQNGRISLEKRINSLNDSVFLASSAPASPNCPVQTVYTSTTEVFYTWMWLGNLKERDEICPSMNELGHGWGAHGAGTMGCDIRVTVEGEQQNKNFGHGNLHYQCEQPAFLLHLRML